jgi:hypothetical protein
MADWRDRLARHRMHVDREFADRVRNSELSRQQWNLVTAVEFRVEHADAPERAELVADTARVDAVLSEVEDVPQGGPGGPDDGGEDSLLGRLVSGLGSESDAAAEAERLAAEYADLLEASLRRREEWDDLRAASREGE